MILQIFTFQKSKWFK